MSQMPPDMVPGGPRTRPAPWRVGWPDALPSGVLYRKAYLRAESASTGRNARAFVAAVLVDWRLVPVLDDAVRCTSELVGNVRQHAVRPVAGSVAQRRVSLGVRCWPSSALVLEVEDDDPRMPCRKGLSDPLADEGRGLFIVDALADRLGWKRVAHGGKIVYARFNLARYGVGETATPPQGTREDREDAAPSSATGEGTRGGQRGPGEAGPGAASGGGAGGGRRFGLVGVGAVVRDVARDQIGRVMDRGRTRVYLRPPQGGTEWEARPEDIRPVRASETLNLRVAEANQRSSRGGL